MTVRIDPEQNETRALFSFVDLDGRRVLEIGCGDGRLTWRYADRAAQVTAIEPFAPALARARENLPPGLVSHVTLCPIAFDEFAAATASSTFDAAIFSWSLCCMEPDDMVPALKEARRLVGPGGTVIDIHPIPGTATVEVYRGGDMVLAEPASASDDEGEVQADAALAQVVAHGIVVAGRRAEFDLRIYASSIRELRDFLAEADAHESPADVERSDAYQSELYERVQQIIGAEDGETEVVYHERAQIIRLTPIGPEWS
jgi:SAM-dependent methyltransferase